MKSPVIACIVFAALGALLGACRTEMPSWPTNTIDLPKPNWP